MRKSSANRDDGCQHIEIPHRIELGRPPEAGVSDWRKRVQMSWRRFSKICVERPVELFEQLNSSIAGSRGTCVSIGYGKMSISPKETTFSMANSKSDRVIAIHAASIIIRQTQKSSRFLMMRPLLGSPVYGLRASSVTKRISTLASVADGDPATMQPCCPATLQT
jgi:hypothetical protein